MSALLLAAALAASTGDTPKDYSHLIPLTISGKQSVVQLPLPRAVYLHALSPGLDDVRVFDATGAAQRFALRLPEGQLHSSRRKLPVRVFPLLASADDSELAGLEINTNSAGRVVSVRLPSERRQAGAQQKLAALVLDLRQEGEKEAPTIDALHFRLPPGVANYNGQLVLEASNDLASWETVSVAELSWLSNASDDTLASDRMEFSPRAMRYARLRWLNGEPIRFAAVGAESPVYTEAAPPSDSLLLPASQGRAANELQYAIPPAIQVTRAGLQIERGNVVLPTTLGQYRTLARGGRSYFDPILRTTFYRLEQDGKARVSADIALPRDPGTLWTFRFEQAPPFNPPLRVNWNPATLIFVASGTPPYALAVGRAHAASAARPLAEVAPGFSASELRALEQVQAGAAQEQSGALAAAAHRASADAGAAQRRKMLLWGILLLGVAVVAWMVWSLVRQQGKQE